MQLVQKTKSHSTADWIYKQARRKMPNISLGTVYRNLGQLVDNKQIMAININGAVHYDAILAKHQHFQCKACNQIYDIVLNTTKFASSIEKKTKHRIDECHVQFYGICEKCIN